MRVFAMACAAAIVFCLTAFAAIMVHRPSQPATAVATPHANPATSAPPAVVSQPARTAAVIETTGTGTATETAATVVSQAVGTQPGAQALAAQALVSQPLVVAQAAPRPAAPPPPPAASPPPPAAPAPSSCANPGALGVSRTVEVNTTGGPGFGFEHFKSHDFLREGEVVLTFDDGPWPKSTAAVLAALQAHCTKAIFFPIGIHATWEPAILKQVAAAGHAVGSHTWCHQDLSKTKGKCREGGKTVSVEYDPKDEIEKGVSAVRWAVGGPTAPYFRFPGLKQPPDLITYLGQRNIAIFSTDLDSFDFKMRKPEQVRQAVMAKLKKHGKGIVLLHDFQKATGEAAMDLMNDLKTGGYKVVFMKPKDAVTTIASYDETIKKLVSVAGSSGPPTSSVLRDVQ